MTRLIIALIAQRHATEAQRAVVEAIGEHMQEWLKARCGART
jgi:hypothetical protein